MGPERAPNIVTTCLGECGVVGVEGVEGQPWDLNMLCLNRESGRGEKGRWDASA